MLTDPGSAGLPVARFKGKHRQEFAWFHLADSMPGLSIGARRAARHIVQAVRHGDPELTITLPARLAVIAKAMSPAVMARLLALTSRLLPSATSARGDVAWSGWESTSAVAPSALTTLADRATVQNNELAAGTDGLRGLATG